MSPRIHGHPIGQRQPGDRADLQAALIGHIVEEQGLSRDYFGTVDRPASTNIK
jgi:hypothetical protein